MKKILVLGLGNSLMNDDASGVIVVNNLKNLFSDSDYLKIVDGGTLGLDLLHYLEWADKLIIVDGVNLEMEPGTVVRIEGDDINAIFESKLSPHQMGLKDILLAAELIDCKPPEIVLFGIQTKDISMDMKLSPEVEKNINRLQEVVYSEIKNSLN